MYLIGDASLEERQHAEECEACQAKIAGLRIGRLPEVYFLWGVGGFDTQRSIGLFFPGELRKRFLVYH